MVIEQANKKDLPDVQMLASVVRQKTTEQKISLLRLAAKIVSTDITQNYKCTCFSREQTTLAIFKVTACGFTAGAKVWCDKSGLRDFTAENYQKFAGIGNHCVITA